MSEQSVSPGLARAASIDLSKRRPSQDAPQWRLIVRRFVQHRVALGGLVLLAIVALAAIFAPLVAPHDPITINLLAMQQSPSWDHWLGTDLTGRDVFSRLIYAGRISLSVGFVAVGISTTIGVILGGISGYLGGKVDTFVMRVTDVFMAVPSLIIIITLVSFVGPSIYNAMIALGVFGWPDMCRLVRGQILSLREREFVEAARTLGARHSRIILIHLLPNTIGQVVVSATFGLAGAILTEAGLSFLGLGVQPPTASWGNMLQSARGLTELESMPWLWFPPGFMIVLSVLAVNFIGDGLRDAFDPQTRDS
jgi:peptide/nickel transport system permease protein